MLVRAGPDSPFWGLVHPVWSKWPLLFPAHIPVAPHPTTDTLPNGNIWLNRQQTWILHPKNSLQHIAWEQGCVISSVWVPSSYAVHCELTGYNLCNNHCNERYSPLHTHNLHLYILVPVPGTLLCLLQLPSKYLYHFHHTTRRIQVIFTATRIHCL